MTRGFHRTLTEKMVLRARALTIDADLVRMLNKPKLPDDCLFIIFDQLSLEHLYRLSLQSDRMNAVAKEYIPTKFKGKNVKITNGQNDQLVFDDPFLAHFLDSAQTITIHGRSNAIIPIVARENRLKPTTIVFKDLNAGENRSTGVGNSSMKTVMKHVVCANFIVNKFDGMIYDGVLKHAENMRHLKIVSTSPKMDFHASYKSKWCFWRYRHLKSIHWDNGIQNQRHFLHLLQSNPGIKTIEFSRKILDALEFLSANRLRFENLRLDLSSTEPKDIASICTILNRLLNQGTYHKLHLTFGSKHVDHIQKIASIVQLESVEFSGQMHPSIEILGNLKELTVQSLGKQTNILKKLPKLQKLNINGEATIDSIRSIIGNMKCLKKMVVSSLKRERLPDVDDMIAERTQLIGASPIDVYLEEWAYINLKKYSAADDLIQIHRIESFQPNF